MLHTWSSENKFFERPADPGVPVNGVYPDVPAPERPAAGTVIKVQDGDGNPLPDLTLGAGGLWSYSFDSDAATFAIQLSEDGGTNWSPSLWSDQSMYTMANSGDLAAQASVDAAEAKALAVASGAKSVNGVTPDGTGNVELTAAVIGAIPSSEKGAVDGVAALGADGKVQNSDGSRPVGKGELVSNVKDFAAKGDGVTDDTAAIQAALDNATGTLLFPPGTYKTTAPLTLSRNIDMVGDSTRRSVIRADFLGATEDLLIVAITDNGGNSDVRNWHISNLHLFQNGGGRHALYVAGTSVALPLLTCSIQNNNLLGYAANGGYSIYIDGNLAHSEVSFNTIQTSIYAKCLDANMFRKNLAFGREYFVTFDVDFGVHNNTVCDNTLVTLNGAVHIINGDAIRVRNNQIELALTYGERSGSPVSSMIWVEGRDRVSYNTVITENNLGGGTNVDHLIYVDNAQKTVIGANQFVAADVAELYFTAASSFNIVRRDNYTRGTTSNPRTGTTFKEVVVDLGTGNAGILKDLPMVGARTGGKFFKDEAGIVHFPTSINGGTTAAGETLATLPPGFRPAVNKYLPAATSLGVATVRANAGDGSIVVTTALPSSAGVSLPSLSAATDGS